MLTGTLEIMLNRLQTASISVAVWLTHAVQCLYVCHYCPRHGMFFCIIFNYLSALFMGLCDICVISVWSMKCHWAVLIFLWWWCCWCHSPVHDCDSLRVITSTAVLVHLHDYYAPNRREGAVSIAFVRLSVCPSVSPSISYVTNNSRTWRPSVSKFETRFSHLRCDSHINFKVRRSKVRVRSGRGHNVSAQPGGHTACCDGHEEHASFCCSLPHTWWPKKWRYYDCAHL